VVVIPIVVIGMVTATGLDDGAGQASQLGLIALRGRGGLRRLHCLDRLHVALGRLDAICANWTFGALPGLGSVGTIGIGGAVAPRLPLGARRMVHIGRPFAALSALGPGGAIGAAAALGSSRPIGVAPLGPLCRPLRTGFGMVVGPVGPVLGDSGRQSCRQQQ
jgi:hypothetical protein